MKNKDLQNSNLDSISFLGERMTLEQIKEFYSDENTSTKEKKDNNTVTD